jgi:hypothetical protein
MANSDPCHSLPCNLQSLAAFMTCKRHYGYLGFVCIALSNLHCMVFFLQTVHSPFCVTTWPYPTVEVDLGCRSNEFLDSTHSLIFKLMSSHSSLIPSCTSYSSIPHSLTLCLPLLVAFMPHRPQAPRHAAPRHHIAGEVALQPALRHPPPCRAAAAAAASAAAATAATKV